MFSAVYTAVLTEPWEVHFRGWRSRVTMLQAFKIRHLPDYVRHWFHSVSAGPAVAISIVFLHGDGHILPQIHATLLYLSSPPAPWNRISACHKTVHITKKQFTHAHPFQPDCTHQGHLRCLQVQRWKSGFCLKGTYPRRADVFCGAIACLWECERWHIYLYGRPFTIHMDHQALAALLETRGSVHMPIRLLRWADSPVVTLAELQQASAAEEALSILLIDI